MSLPLDFLTLETKANLELAAKVIMPAPATAPRLMAIDGHSRKIIVKPDGDTLICNPAKVFIYKDTSDQLLGHILRLEMLDAESGSITSYPMVVTWCQFPSGCEGWAAVGFPRSHSLLDKSITRQIKADIKAEGWKVQQVIANEGSKHDVKPAGSTPPTLPIDAILVTTTARAAEAGQRYVADANMTWQVVNTVDQTDWTFAVGKTAIVWRTDDEYNGHRNQDAAITHLINAGASHVLQVLQTPVTSNQSGDLAGLAADGWTHDRVFKWLADAATELCGNATVDFTSTRALFADRRIERIIVRNSEARETCKALFRRVWPGEKGMPELHIVNNFKTFKPNRGAGDFVEYDGRRVMIYGVDTAITGQLVDILTSEVSAAALYIQPTCEPQMAGETDRWIKRTPIDQADRALTKLFTNFVDATDPKGAAQALDNLTRPKDKNSGLTGALGAIATPVNGAKFGCSYFGTDAIDQFLDRLTDNQSLADSQDANDMVVALADLAYDAELDVLCSALIAAGRDEADIHARKTEAKIQADDLVRTALKWRPLGTFTVEFKQCAYFLDDKHQPSRINRIGLDRNYLTCIANEHFWSVKFGRRTKDDEVKINWIAARDWVWRICRGYWNESELSDRVRGRGFWIDGNNSVIGHMGGHLLVIDPTTGEIARHQLNGFKSTNIYLGNIAVAAPNLSADNKLSREEGRELLSLFQRFSWADPRSAALFAGFVVTAPVCGAMDWRSHIWLTGGAGSGKTTLVKILSDLLLNRIFVQGASTEAGIRQALNSDALPILFDEAESEDDRALARIKSVTDLMRGSSSESDSKVVKGSQNGQARAHHVRAMFCLSSIGLGKLDRADMDRISLLEMISADQRNAGGTSIEAGRILRADIARLITPEAADRLHSRRVLNLHIIRANRKTLFNALEEIAQSPRIADQYATLLAGHVELLYGRAITAEEADCYLAEYGFDAEYFLAGQPEAEHTKLLRTVASLQTNLTDDHNITTGQVENIGTLIHVAAETAEPAVAARIGAPAARRALEALSIAIIDPRNSTMRDLPAGPPIVAIAHSPVVQEMLARTPGIPASWSPDYCNLLRRNFGPMKAEEKKRKMRMISGVDAMWAQLYKLELFVDQDAMARRTESAEDKFAHRAKKGA